MTTILLDKYLKMRLQAIFFICLVGLFISCRSNSLSPDREPTISNVLQIFESTCAGGGCHVGRSASGVRLDSYQAIIKSQGFQYGEAIVQTGNAEESPLINKIEDNPEFGSRMPLGRAPLSEKDIKLIKSWINNGASND